MHVVIDCSVNFYMHGNRILECDITHLLCIIGTRQSSAMDGYKVDTNVFVVKFSSLSQPKPVHTGDPVVCSNQKCTAVLNHLSPIREEQDEKVTVQ